MRRSKVFVLHPGTKSGFTLIEMVIAIGIAALLVMAVYSALVSSSHIAERQAADGGRESIRARAVDLLRADLRSRTSLKVEARADGGAALDLESLGDSIGSGQTRRVLGKVRYVASSKGLTREEGKGESLLVLATGAAALEFWENGDWRKATGGSPVAIRISFSDPAESMVVR